METVVVVLMILVCFNFTLKHTFQKIWWMAIVTLAVALFVGLIWPVAINQTKTQIADWLADSKLMLDMSAVLTVDVVIQMSFCMLAAHLMAAGHVKRRTIWIYKALRWYPGALIFPVAFHSLVQAIFDNPGVPFQTVAWCLAAAVAVAFPLGALLLRYLLPEKELRLELLFLTNALTAILGIIATVNGRTAVAGTTQIDWTALAALAALLIAGTVAGLIIYRNRKIKINY